MKKRFQIKSFLIATFFLVAYLNVFAKQVSCNLSRCFEECQSDEHKDSEEHHHEKNESPAHNDHGHDHHHDKNNSKKEKGCCNDNTSAFFASQGNPIIYTVDFKNTSCVKSIFVNSIFAFRVPVCTFKGYSSYSLPPPKIPDIRVFIQSFNI